MVVLAAVACLSAAGGAAGAADLDAKVDRDTAVQGEQIMLTVTITGDSRDLPSPRLPDIPGATVSQGGTSQNFQVIEVDIDLDHLDLLPAHRLGEGHHRARYRGHGRGPEGAQRSDHDSRLGQTRRGKHRHRQPGRHRIRWREDRDGRAGRRPLGIHDRRP